MLGLEGRMLRRTFRQPARATDSFNAGVTPEVLLIDSRGVTLYGGAWVASSSERAEGSSQLKRLRSSLSIR